MDIRCQMTAFDSDGPLHRCDRFAGHEGDHFYLEATLKKFNEVTTHQADNVQKLIEINEALLVRIGEMEELLGVIDFWRIRFSWAWHEIGRMKLRDDESFIPRLDQARGDQLERIAAVLNVPISPALGQDEDLRQRILESLNLSIVRG